MNINIQPQYHSIALKTQCEKAVIISKLDGCHYLMIIIVTISITKKAQLEETVMISNCRHLMIVVNGIISEHYKAAEEVGLTSLSLSTITFLNTNQPPPPRSLLIELK